MSSIVKLSQYEYALIMVALDNEARNLKKEKNPLSTKMARDIDIIIAKYEDAEYATCRVPVHIVTDDVAPITETKGVIVGQDEMQTWGKELEKEYREAGYE